jgi:galactokinase
MSALESPLAAARAALEVLSQAPASEERAWFVPGRIEVLGKHTDYAGGRSLVCTVNRGFSVVARPRSDGMVGIVDGIAGSRVVFPVRPELTIPRDWTGYPATVIRRLARDFGITRGLDLAFASDLPPAAGLSSSAALCIGVFLALASVNRLAESEAYRTAIPDLLALAGYLAAVENGNRFGPFAGDSGVGTLGGSQDQTAIFCSSEGELAQFSFLPVRFERRIRFPLSQVFVIGACGVAAEKTGSAMGLYNAAAGAVAELLALWRRETGRQEGSLAAALRSSADAPARLAAMLADRPASLRARLEQFAAESEDIIPAAGDALHAGDLIRFGALVDRSQAGAERGLNNQTPETVQLQRSARRLGASAASAFGAGFGGSVWAMVERTREHAFVHDWSAGYDAAFPQHQDTRRFFTTQPGPPVVQL